VITSNKSLTEWGRVLHNSALPPRSSTASSTMGRSTTKGESYRLRGKPRPPDSPDSPESAPVEE